MTQRLTKEREKEIRKKVQESIDRLPVTEELLAELDALRAENIKLLKNSTGGMSAEIRKCYLEIDQLKSRLEQNERRRVRLRKALMGYSGGILGDLAEDALDADEAEEKPCEK